MTDSEDDDFVLYGSPVEQFDEETLPRKKAVSVRDQVVTDKHGRRRFHGAFTGGFSAGFFNSVGSLEGWTPSAFKSSRSDKAKMEKQKPEDFMDEEDMDEFGIAPKVLHATNDFNDSSLKRKKNHQLSDGPIPGQPVLTELLHAPKATVGIKLLMKMGWKPGQGIGPRVTKAEKKKMKEEYGKVKRKVYGCSLPQETSKMKQSDSDDDDDSSTDDDENITFAPEDFQPVLCKAKDNFFGLGFSGLDRRPILSTHINLFEPTPLKMKEKNKKVLITGQAFGVGAFEEEDEDIYTQEDMSQYDFSLESTSATSKQKSQEPSMKPLPNYSENILEGFILGTNCETLKKYFPPPMLSEGFQPMMSRIDARTLSSNKVKQSNDTKKKGHQRHVVTAVERATILGDDVNVSSNVENKEHDVISNVTQLGCSSFKPFAAYPEKEQRYEKYLELLKKGQKERLSYFQPLTMTEWEREREKVEFEKAAVLYKPLSGMMSDRFVSATQPDDLNILLPSVSKPIDADADKRAAANMKMFGKLTREEVDWRPCSLLCKRFNVPELFPGSGDSSNVKSNSSSKFSVFSFLEASSFNKTLSETQCDQPDRDNIPVPDIVAKTEDISDNSSSDSEEKRKDSDLQFPDPPAKVDLFKAIFLSSSDDDSESDEEKQIKVETQDKKETDSETIILEEKNTVLPVQEISTQRNTSPPRGVFANLDLDAVNTHRKVTTEVSVDVVHEDNISNEQEIQDSDIKDMYGPMLPVTKSCASASSTKVIPSIVTSANCTWVEKTKKKHKKHKKSSKHKKSKHKKKKH